MCTMHWQRERNGVPLDAPEQAQNVGNVCQVDACETPARKRGWCSKHYARWQQHGDPDAVLSRAKALGPCSVEGCQRPLYAKGMCHLHRRRLLAGTPIDKALKPLRAGDCAAEDCEQRGDYRGLCKRHRQRADYEENPAPYKAKTAQRRYNAKRGMAADDRRISADYREAISDDPCGYCRGRTAKMHVDHVFPLSKGGTDHWWNLLQTCSTCNLGKYNRCGTWFILTRGVRC
ncbi:HNH endonuclease [Streptomyces scabiei]|uniref:HNH endonuclease n=2 Tax=Streptomyces scabiei TaxID=1930 RepID=UPI001FF17823|nr:MULTISPECIES: HNH endonuclease signature motif containing protein [Streptomyces]MDX3125956.1 HNH endonuclease signature motif containing protein [Streptomyces scabiei]